MFDDISNEQLKNAKSKIGITKRLLEKLLGIVIFMQYVYYFPIYITKDPFTGFYVTKGFVIVGVIISVIMFYSLVRMSTVYCDEMEARLLALESAPQSFTQRFKYIFAQKENRLELIILGAVFLLLPPKALYPGFLWLFGTKALSLAVIIPIFFAVYVLAYISAIKYWEKEGRRKKKTTDFLGENAIKEHKKSEKKQRRRFIMTLYLAYYVGSMGVMFFIPAVIMSIAPLLSLLFEKFVFIAFLLVVFFPLIYRNLKALRKRRKFIKSLKKLCREKKYKLSRIRSPYKSLFSICEGESFSVKIMHKTYSCKMIACKKRGTPIYITPDGKATYLVKVRFLRLVLFSYTKSFSFDYEAEGKKVLIINPVPQRVLLPKTEFEDMMDEQVVGVGRTSRRLYYSEIPGKSTQSDELDNGDIVGQFELYTASAFLNALERDCIDKD